MAEPAQSPNSHYGSLADRISSGTATIGIVGLGYVGLPLAIAFSSQGFPVVGIDIDWSKVDELAAGRSYIAHIAESDVAAMATSGRFRATSDFAACAELDVAILCVPTPLTRHREPDLSYVCETTRSIAQHLRPGCLVVLESTTYPGTTTGEIKPLLEAAGLKSRENVFLAYSPEREDPGNIDHSTASIPKVVGADGDLALKLAVGLYDRIVPRTVPVSSPDTAEAVKLTENIFRAVNIALVNELKVVFDAMGVDIWEVIEAAKTKPFGYMPFYPGPGLGGHCIPIDPFYLTWKAREYDIATRFIELAGEVNTAMPSYVVEKLARALDSQAERGLKGAKILIVGVGYKKNVGDTRESPALKISELLMARGAEIAFIDPYIEALPPLRHYPELEGHPVLSWRDDASLSGFDAAIIVTDHDDVDYQLLVDRVPLIVDTRNVLARGGFISSGIVNA
ncbi:MAG: nucleotide sugar dehydrogenase [Pseudomonadota bacterium]